MPKKVNLLIFALLAVLCGALFIGCSEQTAESSGEATEPDITSQLSVVSEQSTQPEQSHASSSVSSASQAEYSTGIIPNPEFSHSFAPDIAMSYDSPPVPDETPPSVGEQQALFSRLLNGFSFASFSDDIECGMEITNIGDKVGAISLYIEYRENTYGDISDLTYIVTVEILPGDSYKLIYEHGRPFGTHIVAVLYGDEYAEYDDNFVDW